jgi:5-hydroxyisourate hydrolase-like protein (transthyretin family)
VKTTIHWLVACILTLWLTPSVAFAGPPPIDPKQMSGLSRPDPEVPAGALSVRVLRGGFDKPALEHEVTLQLSNADGTNTETRTAKTGNQGRVTFSDLGAFAGGQAIAETTFDDEVQRSQPIEIREDMGSRVMLVEGAATASPEAPLPGVAFPFERAKPGSLMVGTFDLEKRGPVAGVEVTLHIKRPDGEEVTEQATSDKDGRVQFEGLTSPKVPAGSKLFVEGKLAEDGPIKRSNTFEMDTAQGMAVVLANGRLPPARPTGQGPHEAAGAPRLPGPRSVPSLPDGTVRVRVVDGSDQPVADQNVLVIKKVASGNDINFEGTTDATGVAVVSADVDSEAFYMVGVTYDTGPYQSGFFQMDKRGGIAVDVRVYETTSDASVVRSALQFEIQPSENDMARVFRVYEAMVSGDKAFWVPEGLRIEAQAGAKGLTVLRPAEPWLDHEEKADFVTLARPLPPGELVNLSIGYLVEHDGEIEVDFAAPFMTMQSSVVLPEELTLHADGVKPSENEPPAPDVVGYDLGSRGLGAHTVFQVSGLPIRNPIYRRLAIGLGLLMSLTVAVAVATRPRASTRQQLAAQRDRLLALLADEKPEGARRQRVIAALDRVYRQIDVLQGVDAATAAKKS